jgi:nucleotide-binding universal stress UspA family protein
MVLVVHAVESVKLVPISYSYGMGPMFAQDYSSLAEQMHKKGTELASGVVKRLQTAGFQAVGQVDEGDARDVILDWAKKWHPDLVLVGSHGRRGLDRFLLGSVSEAIVRHAGCSVEVVRGTEVAA